MKRGEQYLQDGNLDKAQVEFRNVLQVAPGDINARVMLGRVAERQGSYQEAFGDYRAAVDLDPENPIARAHLARMYMFADEPETALELVEPSLIRYPQDPELLTVRGAAREELHDTPEAFDDARLAVRTAPKNENAVALLASLYVRGGEGAKAVELLSSTLQSTPRSIDLRQILASVYSSLGEPQLAEAQLLEIVRIAPRDFAYRSKLAQFYQQAKRLDDAQRVLKQAVDDLPRDDAAKLAYVDFMSTARSPVDAERILSEFIKRDPDNYDLRLGFAGLQQKAGDAAAAVGSYRRIIAAGGERPQTLIARNRLASMLVTQGEAGQALALIKEVLEKSPRDRDALIMRGNLELEASDPAAAIADLRAVLRDQPQDVPILRTLARAHLASGAPALAEVSLRDAMKAAPKDAGVRLDLAQMLMQSNRLPAAVEILEETVIETPTNLDARVALTRALVAARDYSLAGRATDDLKAVAPQRAVGWYLAGLAALAQNRPDQARAEFEQGLRIEPGTPDLVAALVRLDVAGNRMPDALALANGAVAAAPRSAPMHDMLGELYLANRNYPQGIEQFTQAIQLQANFSLAYRDRALAEIESGDLKAATRTYETALEHVGLSPELVIDLAALYEKQQRIDDAIRLYQKLHDRSPGLGVINNNLAMLLVTYRKDQVSLTEAQELTSAFDHSDSPSLLDTQGWVRLKCGDVAEALPELEAAAARLPKSKVILYHLGMAQLEAKQFAKARGSLETALQGDQHFSGADEARAALAKLRS